MIVLDASAAVELLLQTDVGRRVEERALGRDAGPLHAPHVLDVEVVQALRRILATGDVTAKRADEALEDLNALGVLRHAHVALVPRAWALRRNLSAYDAMYIALAEALDATLVTCDQRLGRAPGHGARIDVVAARRR